jgi:hypothetical protein
MVENFVQLVFNIKGITGAKEIPPTQLLLLKFQYNNKMIIIITSFPNLLKCLIQKV